MERSELSFWNPKFPKSEDPKLQTFEIDMKDHRDLRLWLSKRSQTELRLQLVETHIVNQLNWQGFFIIFFVMNQFQHFVSDQIIFIEILIAE